jgi:hypothetical protein
MKCKNVLGVNQIQIISDIAWYIVYFQIWRGNSPFINFKQGCPSSDHCGPRTALYLHTHGRYCKKYVFQLVCSDTNSYSETITSLKHTKLVGCLTTLWVSRLYKLKTKLLGFGRRANYTDRATAACWRNNANFCGQRVSRVQRNGFPRSSISVF